MLSISPKKLFSFSRYLNFCLDFLVICQSGLTRKIRLVSNFITSHPGCPTSQEQNLGCWKTWLSNISRTKNNQTLKIDQLTEYNMRNINLEKLYTKCGREISPRPFSEKLKISLSADE